MSLKVLVIDDTAVDRDNLKNLLQSKGYSVLTADEGAAGIEMAKQENPDLVLLDVVMPGKSGFEICRAMKKDGAIKDIPVVMVTSKNQKADKVMSELQGAAGHIGKPFQANDVLDVVAKFG